MLAYQRAQPSRCDANVIAVKPSISNRIFASPVHFSLNVPSFALIFALNVYEPAKCRAGRCYSEEQVGKSEAKQAWPSPSAEFPSRNCRQENQQRGGTVEQENRTSKVPPRYSSFNMCFPDSPILCTQPGNTPHWQPRDRIATITHGNEKCTTGFDPASSKVNVWPAMLNVFDKEGS